MTKGIECRTNARLKNEASEGCVVSQKPNERELMVIQVARGSKQWLPLGTGESTFPLPATGNKRTPLDSDLARDPSIYNGYSGWINYACALESHGKPV